jgi:pyrimidine operon attenuation protein/uracil phosphoribosyltransferase
MTTKLLMIDYPQVKAMMKRLAYQVLENNTANKTLLVAGIAGNGSKIASIICEELARISTIKINQVEIKLNKHQPDVNEIILSDPNLLKTYKHVLVVDDVLNSGQTLLYALTPFVRAKVTSIQTLALVARTHRRFPVGADFIGMSLATTALEHVEVEIARGKVKIYLV